MRCVGALLAFCLLAGPQGFPQQVRPRIRVEFAPQDAEQGRAFQRDAREAEKRLHEFFGSGFTKGLILRLCASRAEFDEALRKEWSMPKSETWMVGAAGANHAFFLSPRVWKSEATEHRPEDTAGIARLVLHELTHSYQAQRNPSMDLEGLDPMAWFVEGLATYVSGQEAVEHKGQAKASLSAGTFPSRLEDVWEGKARYGLAGSLVRFVDERFGREKVKALLAATTNAEALALLEVDERRLLDGWRVWLAASSANESRRCGSSRAQGLPSL